MIKEEWRYIAGFTNYQVSNLGRVRSLFKSHPYILKQHIKRKHSKRGKNAAPGYFCVRIVSDLGEDKSLRVHRLVLKAFVGPEPTPKHIGAHIDGNSLNNWLPNLKWATQLENERDKEAHGTKLLGTAIHNARLNPAKVRRIKAVKTWNEKILSKFMVDLGVSRSTIRDVIKGRTWKHIV